MSAAVPEGVPCRACGAITIELISAENGTLARDSPWMIPGLACRTSRSSITRWFPSTAATTALRITRSSEFDPHQQVVPYQSTYRSVSPTPAVPYRVSTGSAALALALARTSVAA
ncbi:hypothetical protein BH23GEM3_BH23GEM3_14520 [soil metagenome]|nr:hypothetical protein [Gemmatimonadota bacterium]